MNSIVNRSNDYKVSLAKLSSIASSKKLNIDPKHNHKHED